MGKRRKDLADKINEILGTSLEFKRVPLAELEKLFEAVSAKIRGVTQEPPVGHELQGLLDAPLIQVLRKRLEHKKIEELTVRDFLSIIQEGTGGRGIFGLGVLPALLRRR